MDNILSSLISAKIGGILKQAEELDDIPHEGLRGRFRELLVAGILEPLLPPTCAVLHGTVIDSKGERFRPIVTDKEKKKTEDDVLVVDKEVLPSFHFSAGEGIVPLEAVLARIEVKTELNSTNLKDALSGARQFRRLHLEFPPTPQGQALQGIFAFRSDLTKKSEYARLKEALAHDPPDSVQPEVQGICVVRRGFWYYGPREKDGADAWRSIRADKSHSEVLSFIGGLMNTLPEIRAARKPARLGTYIVNTDSLRDCD